MKKIIFVLLIVVLIFSFSSCETLGQIWDENWRDWAKDGTEAALDAGSDFVKETVEDWTTEEETSEDEETEEAAE